MHLHLGVRLKGAKSCHRKPFYIRQLINQITHGQQYLLSWSFTQAVYCLLEQVSRVLTSTEEVSGATEGRLGFTWQWSSLYQMLWLDYCVNPTCM